MWEGFGQACRQDARAEQGVQDMAGLIVNTDCGVDDALGLILALNQSELPLLGVTCSFGNGGIHQVLENVHRILNIYDRLEVPVYKGSHRALLEDYNSDKAGVLQFHGNDAFGDVSALYPVPQSLPNNPEHAANALVRLTTERPGELTILSIAPLTNLLLAQRICPQFCSSIKQLIIMGGTMQAAGNISANTEFNFACDPEAAAAVIKEFSCPILLLPWETCHQYPIPWEEFESLVSLPGNKAEFFKKLTSRGRTTQELLDRSGYVAGDLLAAAVTLQPQVITDSTQRPISVECHGSTTRGQVVVDWRESSLVMTPNVEIITEVDVEKVTQMLRECLL